MSNRSAFPIGAFITGLVVGATAVYFSDEKNRKKAMKAMEQGLETLGEVRENPELLAEMAKRKAEEAKKLADSAYHAAAKKATQAGDGVKRLAAGKTKPATAKKAAPKAKPATATTKKVATA